MPSDYKDEYELAIEKGCYIERDCYLKLLDWKNRKARNHNALFIRGARRVGKSVLALEFAHKEYKSFIKISFDRANDDLKSLFLNELNDLEYFYSALETTFSKKLYRGESLIILDEIQLFKPARQAIKTLLLDGRYDIIETGSLASVVKSSDEEDYLLPSEETKIDVNPLSFLEFLKACDDELSLDFMKQCFEKKKPLGAVYRRIYLKFREYLLVGGMPAPLSSYIKNKSLVEAEEIKREIIELYRDDFSKQKKENPIYVASIFDMIPSELSNHDKRFKYTHINSQAREREYYGAFNWLVKAYIVNPCFNSTDPSVLPTLTMNGFDFKAYLIDTGLLYTLSFMDNSQDEFFYKSLILDKLHINEGMFAENYISQALKNNGKRLFYYEKRDENTHKTIMEIDFLTIQNRKITPLEVKSGDKITVKSLTKFKETFTNRVNNGIVLYDGDLKISDQVLYLPLFMVDYIDKAENWNYVQ